MTREMAQTAAADYAKFDFYLVAQRLQTFCSEDLGGFWLDILKDRLYTNGKSSKARRSAQSALHHVTQILLRLMAPMLSFTAEEAWAILNPTPDGDPPDSVFMHTWNDVLPKQEGEKELIARWSRIREIRAEVLKRLEDARAGGAIGSSLQANVSLHVGAQDLALLRSLGEDLKFVLITSSATVGESSDGAMAIEVRASRDAKCERCWHYRKDVGASSHHPTICGRCVENLEGAGERRAHA